MGRTCPNCGSLSTVSYGKSKKGRPRFRCSCCGRTFSATTGTVMASAKIGDARLAMMINLMANDTKIEAIADSVGVSPNTAHLWRMKVYSAASELQKNEVLSDTVWIDEKLVPVNGRLEFRYADGKRPRGVSRNQVCIACAVDAYGNRYAEIAGRGHISSAQCIKTYGKHIAKGSTIIHDGIFSHDRLISFVGGPSEVYKSTSRESHARLQPVNSFIAEIERYIVVHSGIDTENLALYLGWISYKGRLKGEEIGDKIGELLRICSQTKAVFKR